MQHASMFNIIQSGPNVAQTDQRRAQTNIALQTKIPIFDCAVLSLIKTSGRGNEFDAGHAPFCRMWVGCGLAADCAIACEMG